MAEGKAVQVSPVEAELSTQEAADMLGVSRPFLVKLLEQGKIPFKKVGSHRRIELKNLQAYERKQKAIREKNLAFLAKQAQDLNPGY
jgi:excisionase family DNA binding protein